MTTAPSSSRRFLTDEGEPRAFIIVSSARSGSNLLVTYLRQVKRAACFGEVLRSEFPDKPGWDKLIKRLDMPADSKTLHARDLTSWWQHFVAQGLRQRRWLGAKAFYYHRRDDPIWHRFEAEDHRVIHLWRDATFDQYVSRLLAVESGQWKAPDADGGSSDEPRVTFDREDYLRYRALLRTDITATRTRFGDSDRYVEIEYRQLSQRDFMADLLDRLFGERIEIRKLLRRQRGRPKIEYLRNPAAAEPFVSDSIEAGFAPQ